MTNEDICMDCLIAGARNVVCADSYRDRRISMKEIALSVLSGNYPDGTYFVSRTWYCLNILRFSYYASLLMLLENGLAILLFSQP